MPTTVADVPTPPLPPAALKAHWAQLLLQDGSVERAVERCAQKGVTVDEQGNFLPGSRLNFAYRGQGAWWPQHVLRPGPTTLRDSSGPCGGSRPMHGTAAQAAPCTPMLRATTAPCLPRQAPAPSRRS